MDFPRKNVWLISPFTDLVFLIGFPAIFLVLLLGNSFITRLFPANYGDFSKNFLYWFVQVHFFATFALVYLDRNELRKLFLYVWIPLILCVAYSIAILMGYRNFTATILFYVIIYHEIFQFYYIMLAYNLRRIRYSKIDLSINIFALVLGPVYSFLHSLIYFKYDYGGRVLTLTFGQYFLNGVRLLAFLSIAVFIARQIYIYLKRKEIFLFNILLIFTSNCVFYLPLIIFKNKDIFTNVSFRYYHSVQYLVWLLFYFRFSFDGRIIKGAEFISRLSLSRGGIYFFAFFIIAALIYNYGLKNTVNFFRSDTIATLGFYNLALVHVYLDMVYWWNPARRFNRIMATG